MAAIKSFIAMQAHHWAESVIFQGERVFAHYEWTRDMNKKIFELSIGNQKSFDIAGQLSIETRQKRFISIMEEHFFVIALGKSIDYLKLIPEYDHLVQDIDAMFSIESINNLRNKREHDDEYFYPDGRNVRLRPGMNFEDVSRSLVGDMTSSFIDDYENKYYLGNVEIKSIVAYYKSKVSEIECIYKAISRASYLTEEP